MQKTICQKIIALRSLLLLVAIVITAFFVYQATKIRIYDDPLKWPPANAHNVIVNNEIQDLFGGANLVTIQLTVKEGDIFDSKVLEKVKNISDGILLMDGVVPSYMTSLSAQKVKYMKGTADLLTIEPLMEYAPETEEEMERLKEGLFNNPLLYGPIVSIDKKSTIIIGDFRTGDRNPGEPTYFRTTPLDIYEGVKKITEPENDSNTTVKCAGSPIIIGWVNSEGIPFILITFCGFLVVMCIVLFFIFKNWRGVFIPVLVGIICSFWGFGLYTLFYGTIFGSASCLLVPFLIMASATCHTVQFLKRFINEEYPRTKESKAGLVNTFHALVIPMLAALITDFLSFVVLWAVPFSNVSLMGRVGALGLLSLVIVIAIFVIPFLSYFPGKPKEAVAEAASLTSAQKSTQRFDKIALWCISPKGKGILVGLSVVLVIISLPVLFRLDIGQDNTYAIHNYLTKSWKNNEIFQMEMNIKEKFKGVYTCNLMIDTKERDGMKSIPLLKAMDEFSVELQKRCPEIAGFLHLPTYIKLMNRFMHEEKPEYFLIPDNPKAIPDYILMYTMGETGAFDSIIDASNQKAPIGIYVDSTSHATVRKVLNTIRELVPKYFGDKGVDVKVAGGTLGITEAFNESIKVWLVLSLVISLIISGITLMILFRSFLAALFLLIPPIFAIIYTITILSLFGIEINSNISTVAAIGVGVGVDAACYLLFRFREEFKARKDFKEAMVQTFVTAGKANTASYLTLVVGCWSVIPIPLYLGYTGFGLGLVLLLNLLITTGPLVALWMIFRPKFLVRTV